MFKRFMAVMIVLAFGTTTSVKSQVLCPDGYHAIPSKLAASLLPTFEHLYAAIPSLSPREEKWLKEELRGHGKRSVKAYDSREYALNEAKINAGSLLGAVRTLNGKFSPRQYSPKREWLFLVYTLIASDADLYLAKLFTDQVVGHEALPYEWKWMAAIPPKLKSYRGGRVLQDSIRNGRSGLARHILLCTLPTLMSIKDK